jgi:hypothetical protein
MGSTQNPSKPTPNKPGARVDKFGIQKRMAID